MPYTCVGGWWAFDYLIKKGVATENSYPYTAVQSGCNDSIDRSYQALTWKYVLNQSDVPTTDAQINQIKAALCQYGPIGAAVYATAPIFGGYGPTSPPIRDFDSGNKVVGSDGNARIVDHVVVIVGWNDAKKGLGDQELLAELGNERLWLYRIHSQQHRLRCSVRGTGDRSSGAIG